MIHVHSFPVLSHFRVNVKRVTRLIRTSAIVAAAVLAEMENNFPYIKQSRYIKTA